MADVVDQEDKKKKRKKYPNYEDRVREELHCSVAAVKTRIELLWGKAEMVHKITQTKTETGEYVSW